jgi:leucyl-tRNA synthetase
MSPVIPHICEELNERMGDKEYNSLKQIPDIAITDEDELYALEAKYMTNLIEDIEQIVKLVKTKPKKIHIYINAEWKNELYKMAQEIFVDEAFQIGKLMNAAKESSNLSKHMKEISNEAKLMLKDPTIFRIEMLSSKEQEEAIMGYKEFIVRTFDNAEVLIHMADAKEIHDPQNKAQKARPMKPALLLE